MSYDSEGQMVESEQRMQNEIDALRAQLAECQQKLEQAKHVLESYRVWNGMEWEWAASHPFHAKRAWEILTAALSAAKGAG